MTRRGRPFGQISMAVLEAVRSEPATVYGLASRLQLSYRQTNWTVSRLQSAGHVSYGPVVEGRHDRPARLVQLSAEPEAAQCVTALRTLWRL
jgi:hypothetical protein